MYEYEQCSSRPDKRLNCTVSTDINTSRPTAAVPNYRHSATITSII